MTDNAMATPEAPEQQTASAGGGGQNANKVALQFKKLRETNDKYKDVLKMAKERIQEQEDEIKRLKAEAKDRKEQMEAEERDAANMMSLDDADVVGDAAEHSCTIVRVCQSICVDLLPHEINSQGGRTEYWALIEFEMWNPDQPEHIPAKRMKKWKRFDSESNLQDFVRRDTGEPIVLPPVSLTPQQSAKIQEDANRKVSDITEEFRRFRVKSEMTRKQADQQIRELQNSKVETTKRQIEDNNQFNSAAKAKMSQNEEVEQLKMIMANQEAQWKRAYDMLLDQNEMLQSSGSEALLASQWRTRYEGALREKQDLEAKLKKKERSEADGDGKKLEEKYRDLKESFRLYRKKAKEIFEAQQKGETGFEHLAGPMGNGAESKLDYLRNLMVNYLTSEHEVRNHMEIAIGTVLQFTPDDISRIDKKKKDDEYWNLF
eukprot:CAMPEP_0119550258 /NCGR_PEP_ID=MMETSP1352-20130426/3796_1 /TAXON_ID=265584 /ORGANISM="Stauroneis constricta, Strain CCMP1120" /LENGTH=431 /DNA_ID=CAMNT_0007596043 /DNA_START=138 /DNA_END=1433 /DNA_ORIENTATION=+